MINRANNTPVELNISGSSTFGRYPKISLEKTYNMFISDDFLVPYAGYQVAIPNLGISGRAIHTSSKLNKMIVVIDNNVYLVNIFFDQNLQMSIDSSVENIGQLATSIGVVYIAENNKPQIAISDGDSIYIYDTTLTPNFQVVPNLLFKPGYIDFHDTYFLCAPSEDEFEGNANNTWRISAANDGFTWSNDATGIGILQTKSDNTQAVLRFPSKGNMIFVMGKTVTESWFDVGYKNFPYQRNTSYNIDYGCLNPATIAATDEVVVWLAQNEKSGPIILYSDGGMPKKITTDGIDFLFSQLSDPQDSQAFIYRQDGHLIYHINFYADNLSLFYDFNTQKFFHASDENMNYFIANSVAFFNNQYYFVSKRNGNIYAFDTIYTTYDGAEIPRIRICKSLRKASQEYFIVNDVGFTIEQGTTPYLQQSNGDMYLISQDNRYLITQDDNYIISEQSDIINSTPRVDLSISIDGGESFGSSFAYDLNPLGKRRNKILWWQLGICNEMICQFRFWGIGRFAATNGIANIRI